MKRTRLSYKTYWIIPLVLILKTLPTYAQNNVTEQIEVKRQYKPILGPSQKIRKSPVFTDESSSTLKQSYSFRDILLKRDTASNSITADSLNLKNPTGILPFYVRGGGGNFSTVVGEISYNSLPKTSFNFGINYKHESLVGKLENQKFSSDQISFDGKKVLDANYISAHFGVLFQSNPFYGYDHSTEKLNYSAVKQDFRNLSGKIEFGRNRDTASGIHYHAIVDGYYLGDSYSEYENHENFRGGLGFSTGNFSFNLGGDYENNIFVSGPNQYNNSIGRILPSIVAKTDLFRAQLGIKIVYELGDRNQVYVFPDLSLDLLLAEGFNIYGGLKGDILQTSFKDLTVNNPYYVGTNLGPSNSGLSFQNTKQSILFYGGIKGAFNENFNYRAQVDIGQLDRAYFFINNFSNPDNFSLVYDGNRTLYSKIYAEINYQLGDQLRINTHLSIIQYKLSSLPKAWYTPNYKLDALLTYTPLSDWLFTANLFALGTQYAQGPSGLRATQIPPGSYSYLEIKPHLDLNFGIEYRLSRKLGVFLQGNNLFNQEYQRFYNYPVVGLNVLGGLTLRF